MKLKQKQAEVEKKYGKTRKDFKANGGEDWKQLWDSYKGLSEQVSTSQSSVDYYTEASKKTDAIIAKWKKESPNTFEKTNSMKNEKGERVDFMLGVSDQADEWNYGMNQISYVEYQDGNKIKYLPTSKEFGLNKVVAFINPNTLIDRPDPATGQYSLNHEAGHFLYWAANSTAYILYRLQLIKEKQDNEGGHRKDDLSGQSAEKYGKQKDLKD